MKVGPGEVARIEITAERLATITGRVVDSTTGKGLSSVPIHCYRLEGREYIKSTRTTQTDTDGRYSIAAVPGVVKVMPEGLPQSELVPRTGASPDLEVTGDRVWPELTLARATFVEGIVVDETGQPVADGDVYMLDGGPRRQEEMTRTGPGGRFRFDELDPDATISLWARTNVATTNGAASVRPGDFAGKVRLTIDPKFACQIRGLAVDEAGKRIVGPRLSFGGRGHTPVSYQKQNRDRLS